MCTYILADPSFASENTLHNLIARRQILGGSSSEPLLPFAAELVAPKSLARLYHLMNE